MSLESSGSSNPTSRTAVAEPVIAPEVMQALAAAEKRKSPERKAVEALVTPEKREIIDKIAVTGLQKMHESIEEAKAEGYERPFHGLNHPGDVKEGELTFLGTVAAVAPELVKEEDVVAAEILAATHDSIVDTLPDANLQKHFDGTPNPKELGKLKRARAFNVVEDKSALGPDVLNEVKELDGGNERRSAKLALDIIAEHDTDRILRGTRIPRKVVNGIAATYPEVKFPPVQLAERFKNSKVATLTPTSAIYHVMDPETGETENVDLTQSLTWMKGFAVVPPGTEGAEIRPLLFEQSYIDNDADISTLAAGIGDLSYSGLVDPESFDAYGNAEYREINREVFDIVKGVKEGTKSFGEHDSQKKAIIAKEVIGWINNQVDFVFTQMLRFEHILATNNTLNRHPKADELKAALWNKWGKGFEKNLLHSKKRAERISHQYQALLDPAVFDEKKDLADLKLAYLLEEIGF